MHTNKSINQFHKFIELNLKDEDQQDTGDSTAGNIEGRQNRHNDQERKRKEREARRQNRRNSQYVFFLPN